jgi:hypothetical protein
MVPETVSSGTTDDNRHTKYKWFSSVQFLISTLSKDKTVQQHTYGGARGERRYSSYLFTT